MARSSASTTRKVVGLGFLPEEARHGFLIDAHQQVRSHIAQYVNARAVFHRSTQALREQGVIFAQVRADDQAHMHFTKCSDGLPQVRYALQSSV
mgnify:CR=1 FL=1